MAQEFLWQTKIKWTSPYPIKLSQAAKHAVVTSSEARCCHKQRSTLWLGTCPNPPPPYKLSHKLKEKSNLINMLMIIVLFFSLLWHVITQSVCFEFLMIVPLIVICVCDDELYTLYENLHYHLNDFVTQIWLEAVTLILSFVFL